MKELNSHVNRGFRKITDEFATALELMSELLESNLLRPVDVNFTDWVHVYVDASFEPGKYSGLGGLVLDSSGQCLGCFSEVSQELVSKIKREDQQTVIFELEGLAIAVALEVFKEHIKGKRLVVFTDNSGAQASLIKCKSTNHHMNLIVRSICSLEESLGLMTWTERVPSFSNPADELSRKKLLEYAGVPTTPVDLLERWDACVTEECAKPSQDQGRNARRMWSQNEYPIGQNKQLRVLCCCSYCGMFAQHLVTKIKCNSTCWWNIIKGLPPPAADPW